MSDWKGPLGNVRVLDFTRVLAGPFATMLLGDLGAEVIKIESPERGDDTRGFPPFLGELSHYFIALNRSKKSMALDLRRPEAVAIVHRLVQDCDILVENFRPGVMERLGLGYEALAKINPRLIYCGISGFGATGAMRDKPSFDIVTQALSGAMSVNGEPGQPPTKLGLPLGDMVGGVYGSIAVLAALNERAETGRGRKIDISLLDGLIGMLGYLAQIYFVTGQSPSPVGTRHPNLVPYGAFQAADGYVIVACLTEEFWKNLARAIGRAELIDDPRFATYQSRQSHREELDRLVQEAIGQEPVSHWLAVFEAGDVPHAPILSVGEALEHPNTLERGMVERTRHPEVGEMRLVGRPIRFEGQAQAPLAPPPLLGENGRAILESLLGMGREEIDSLIAAGVVGSAGEPPMKAAFEGLVVVELGNFIAAPYCAKLLADLGARVIKIEAPGGDESRAYGPFPGDTPDPEASGLFVYLNGGKESVVLDLEGAEGRGRLGQMLATADVLVSNLPIARQRALGLDFESLRGTHERLVVASLSVFGSKGPWADLEAQDLQAQALSGVSWAIGSAGREPLIMPYTQGDFQAGAHGAAAIAMALLARERSGRGQQIDIASADVLAAAAGTNALIYLYYGLCRWGRAGNRALGSGGPYPYVILPCKDGSVCLIGRARREWEKLVAAMGNPAWSRDPRYQDLHAMGRDYPEEVDALLRPWLMQHTRAELMQLAAEYNFPLGPLRTMEEVVSTPQFLERGFFLDVEGGGVARPVPSPPFRLSATPLALGRRAPRLGEHTQSVLAQLSPSPLTAGAQDQRGSAA